MSAINFPSNPTEGQTHEAANILWVYSATKGRWEATSDTLFDDLSNEEMEALVYFNSTGGALGGSGGGNTSTTINILTNYATQLKFS